MITLFIFILIYSKYLAKGPYSDFYNESNTDQFYYQAPALDVKNMNLTLGMSVPLLSTRGTSSYQLYAGAIMATICQADQINQGLYDVLNFTGTINLAFQEYSSSGDFGQAAAIDLLKSNLYNSTTGIPLSDKNINNLAGFVGIFSDGRNRINSAATNGFELPFLNPGSLNQMDPSDDFAVVSQALNKTYFQVRSTIDYGILNAVLGLMSSYNWTIAASIYQNNVLGLISQQSIGIYESTYKSPIFTCNFIQSAKDLNSTTFYKNVCNCMTNINTLTVLNIWTDESVAYSIIRNMKQNCKAAEKFVFIVTVDSYVSPQEITENEEDFKSVFVFRPFGPLNFTSYINNCIKTGTTQAKSAIKTILIDAYREAFNCYEHSESTSTLPLCSNNIQNRPVPCICTGLEFDPRYNSYSSQNFFFSDSVSNVAFVISLLQENCTNVNELLNQRSDSISKTYDFCKIENITPTMLTRLLTLANYYGYTGPISYPPHSLNYRSIKSYHLYNIHTSLKEAKLVGNFSITGITLDYQNIILPNGNNTTSELTPQNPGLEYPSVAVFFGILIFLLVSGIVALIILIYFKDHILIRRNTPNISFIVLIGVIFVNIAGIFSCIDISTASCILYEWFFAIGFACIIGGIIAKEYRIYRIFYNETATAVKLKDSTLFLIVLVLIIYVCCLVAASWISGMSANIMQSSSDPFYLYYACSTPNRTLGLIIIFLSELSFIFFQLIALFLAWKIRKITSVYSESKSVFVVVAVMICIDVCLLPLYEALRDGTDSAVVRRTIRLIKISMTLTVILVFIFYYRYWKVYKYEKKIKNSRRRESSQSNFPN